MPILDARMSSLIGLDSIQVEKNPLRPSVFARELRDLMAGTDGLAIEQQTKRLTQVTDAFAARRLDATVKAALAGRSLDEIEE